MSEELRRFSRRIGIRRLGFLMLGGPGETRETVNDSLDFADSLHLDGLKITIGIRIYQVTAVWKAAIKDGLISPKDDLLLPKFYIIQQLNDWLHETVQAWKAERPYCINSKETTGQVNGPCLCDS